LLERKNESLNTSKQRVEGWREGGSTHPPRPNKEWKDGEREEAPTHHVQTKSGRMESEGGSTHPPTHHVHALLLSSSRFNKTIDVGPPSTRIQISQLAETFFQPNCRQNVPHEKMGSAMTFCSTRLLLGYVGLKDCVTFNCGSTTPYNIRRRSLLDLIVRNS
jgi:hypothetical protein